VTIPIGGFILESSDGLWRVTRPPQRAAFILGSSACLTPCEAIAAFWEGMHWPLRAVGRSMRTQLQPGLVA
jgi:hypothetical protein